MGGSEGGSEVEDSEGEGGGEGDESEDEEGGGDERGWGLVYDGFWEEGSGGVWEVISQFHERGWKWRRGSHW